jgi:hypothetical protein
MCAGDCNGDREVTVAEIIVEANIALGSAAPGACWDADFDEDDAVTVANLVAAVNAAMNGCSAKPEYRFQVTSTPRGRRLYYKRLISWLGYSLCC